MNSFAIVGRIPQITLINSYLSACLRQALLENRLPALLEELNHLKLNEILETLPLSLDLSSLEIPGESFKMIVEAFPETRKLNLSRSSIKDEGFAHIARVRSLRHLDLRDFDYIKNEHLIHLAIFL